MMQSLYLKHLLSLPLLLCLAPAFGCGGSNGGGGGSTQNPVPTLSGVTPNAVPAGSAAVTVTASGSGFISTSVIDWNGAALATTYLSSTSLTAQVPASDLGSAGAATVAVKNPAPGGGTSSGMTFTINAPATNLVVIDVVGADLAWNASQQQLYVAVPATAGANPSSIAVVNPITGSITSTQSLNSAASEFAISSDSQYLYAVISGGSTIQRFTLPAITPDINWSLGTNTFGTQNIAGDIEVQPNVPHTLAVSLGQFGSGSVAVFDDGVARPTLGGGGGNLLGNSLQWKADGSELYAAFTGNTAVSDDALYTMPVSSNGVGAVTTYNSSFRGEGSHLHSDPTTGYVYGDWGEIVNAASGIPIGNYRWSRSNGGFYPGPLSIVDPTLQLFYTLMEIRQSDGTAAFQIQTFNQTQFQQLHTIIIPNAVGEPTNFIRWGQSGLAFVTNYGANNAGKLYILDGSFVNPSGVLDTSGGNPISPVPTLTAISPLTATVGSQAATLSVTGRDFGAQPTVYWNGTALSTTVVNSTELSAQVPASDLIAVSQATITVSNSETALPSSNALPFSINTAPTGGNQISVFNTGGNNLVWNATAGKIYVSMPGVQGDAGDAIAIVDPVAGSVSSSGFLGSDPAALSLSDDGQYLYAALYGANAIQQLVVPALTVNTTWNLGGVDTFEGPYFALDLQVAPGASQTTAVTLANFNASPSSAEVVIYDGSTARSAPLQSSRYSYFGLKWAGNASTLYAIDQGIPQSFLVLGVGSTGAVLDQHYDGVFSAYSPGIHYDTGTGLVYTDAGEVFQPSNGTIVGSYGSSGTALPDSTLGTVFILGQTSAQLGTSNYTIDSFDQTTFAATGSIIIQNVVGTPTGFVRWGTSGLAFTTRVGAPYDFIGTGPGQLYVVSGTFVQSSKRLSRSQSKEQLLPVHRTWDLETGSGRQSRSVVKGANPLLR